MVKYYNLSELNQMSANQIEAYVQDFNHKNLDSNTRSILYIAVCIFLSGIIHFILTALLPTIANYQAANLTAMNQLWKINGLVTIAVILGLALLAFGSYILANILFSLPVVYLYLKARLFNDSK